MITFLCFIICSVAGFLIFAIIASPIRDEIEENKKQMYKDRLK